MNFDITIESIIGQRPNADFIITRDWNGINAGVFLIKCIDWSKSFLIESYSAVQFINHPFQEQQAIYETMVLYHNRAHYAEITKKSVNSYPNDWSNGDFVIHQPGCVAVGLRSPNYCISSLRGWLPKVKK